MEVSQNTPEEKLSFINGKKFFWYRAGPYNFSCATCHAEDGKQIKISKLPNLSNSNGEKAWVAATWPAYPDSQGVVRTLEWRMNDCMRQQRIAEPKYLSQVVIDLETYMGVMAKGHKILTPSFKR
jgi:sulfur-oxidizing protein SoxA